VFPSSDVELVLEQLIQSTHLRPVHLGFPTSTILKKLANLHGLRGILLYGYFHDWSALTKVRSLQTLTLHNSKCSQPDSPLFSASWPHSLQEWQRTEDGKFHLRKLRTSFEVDGRFILSEPHLQELDICYHPKLELPTDRTCPPRITLRIFHMASTLVPLCVHSLLFLDENFPFERWTLALSNLRSLEVHGTTFKSVSQALTQSKPTFLTSLELHDLTGSFEPLAQALLECSALTNLVITEEQWNGRDVLPLAQMLHALPLTKLTLNLYDVTDESIRCVLSLTALQDLKLGTLSPNQLQLVADALPSLSSLHSLTFDTYDFTQCQHESAHLALFSALASSSLRSLTHWNGYFRFETLEACLNKILNTQLTQLLVMGCVYADGFDPSLHDDSYPRVKSKVLQLDWHLRFPEAKDRFCIMDIDV
jgi:hypothetical protein